MSEAEIPSSPGFNAYHSSFSGDSNVEVDPEYEYDAPKFTPFKQGTSDGADQWFGMHIVEYGLTSYIN